MGLLEKVTQRKRSAYYTYRLMREKLRDFEIGNVSDLSIGSIRVFKFLTPNGAVYVAWDVDGADASRSVDLSSMLGGKDVLLTPIITELAPNDTPIVPEAMSVSTTTVPLSITPVFIE